MVQCFVKRTKAGGLFPSSKRTYLLCNKDGTNLANTTAHGGTTETSYVIHMGDSSDERAGKLKWNGKGNEFQLVDAGANLKKLSWEEREALDRGDLHPRVQLCNVSHSTN